ncbi:carbamate kinase [Balneicella halophila]|uniref:Carbamate kinase n=1 Tax=Balneicella halophila TaxID=1537566 RepID=A0A7L4USB8_BALHA|nr:carbamate kinase [Balneicella halophila]PVX52311.1 carbamate kinase [Balneicella halophila]
MSRNKLAVVALGGNALLRGNQKGTNDEQNQNTLETLNNLVYLAEEGYNLIISHGNGPQVGNILMRNDAGDTMYDIPQMPLDICVADSQGGIGYMIERNLRNVLRERGINRNVITVVTEVAVRPDDPAFSDPQKRVGRIYEKKEADELNAKLGWEFKEEVKKPGGWRRVVPSPEPLDILNHELIKELAEAGNIVIAVGGGGVPVAIDEKGNVEGVEAVIDKDRASSLLGHKIGADEFYILTDVPFIYKDFNKPTQEKLEFLSLEEAKKYIAEGQFSKGSMEPKVQACVNFVENGGEKAIITEATKLEDKSFGSKISR